MKYKWMYVDELEPVDKVIALSLGSIVHTAFELFYRGFNDKDILDYIDQASRKQVALAEACDQEDWEIARYMALGIWLGYPRKNSPPKEAVPEESFCVPLIHEGENITWFNGRIDTVYKEDDGTLWIREIKVTSLSPEQFRERQRQSAQVTGYIWAKRKQGTPVKGVKFDYVRKPALRKGKNETMSEYGARIVKDYQARPDHYYEIYQEERSDDDLLIWETEMKEIAEEIAWRKQKQKWYRNPEHCFNYNHECPYMKICWAKEPDPTVLELYYKKRERRPKNGNPEPKDPGPRKIC